MAKTGTWDYNVVSVMATVFYTVYKTVVVTMLVATNFFMPQLSHMRLIMRIIIMHEKSPVNKIIVQI